MGAAASIAKAELAKPADGSDVADSVEAARAEVVRLRALIKAQVEESRAEPLDEEAAAGTEVWAYVGTARNAAGTVFGDYNFRRVLFDRGDAEEKASVTMDIEYTPASEGSVGGYRSRYKMDWDVETGHIGIPGESWQGTLTNGGIPGAPMDFRNKWNNILDFQPVRRLPASALLDEDNPPGADEPPLTPDQATVGAQVADVPADAWTQAKWFIENPILSRKEEYALGQSKHTELRSKAFAWLLGSMAVDEPSDELVLLVKRLLKARRFTAGVTSAQFSDLVQLCAEKLDVIGSRLASYYDTERLQDALGQLGADRWLNDERERPRQHDVIPTPVAGCVYPNNSRENSSVSLSEYIYINTLILIGMGVNAEFQERAAAAVERAAPGSIYKAAPIKGFHRMYNKLWFDHRDAGAPRPSRNVDVVRACASMSTPAQVVAVFDELQKEFSNVRGIRLCKNNFTDTDASDVAHYRAVYAICDYAPREPQTFAQLAERSRPDWEKYLGTRDPLEQGAVRKAMAKLSAGGDLADAPVRMYCEVQLLLDTYMRTRGAMHLLYKIKRANNAQALWRDFSGRVQPKPSEAGAII